MASTHYVRNGIPLGRRPELVGGGLIRNLGGWENMLRHFYPPHVVPDL